MTKRLSKTLWNTSFKRILSKVTRTATRAGAKAIVRTLALPQPRKPGKTIKKARPALAAKNNWTAGISIGTAGARRYHLYRPPGVRRTERLPLMVMLHGCGQDGAALASSSKMNQLAARKRFLVLYPEQERLANTQACWNWYDTRSGRAQREASSIDAVIDQLCLSQAIDPHRIAVAGLSAGASMAALLALSQPERYRTLAMHSGIATGLAHSAATAVMAMRGRRRDAAALAEDVKLPALLVIQGSHDHVVAPANGLLVAQQWAAQSGAQAGLPRTVQRGARYPATVTDYRLHGQVVVSLCEISGLGHAWSGGAAGHTYSDPRGPDASGMIWAFASKHFL